jgi:alpha-L-arabinofuranosidase
VDDSGLGLSADLQESAQRQPHRPDGEAGRTASAFLRFPGGNYLEGDHINERYEWKKTIGPLVDRPTHPSPWNYHSSDGLGLLEFLEWCEDLHMQNVLAVYAATR